MTRPTGHGVDPAREFSKHYHGTYSVRTRDLALRRGPRVTKQILKVLQHGDKVTCYGFFTKTDATTWLFVMDAEGNTGYCSYRCLTKVL